jgi:hypothetical protein
MRPLAHGRPSDDGAVRQSPTNGVDRHRECRCAASGSGVAHRGLQWAATVGEALLAWHVTATAQVHVSVPSFDAPSGSRIELPGFWYAAPAAGRAPAWLLLHGCGGPFGRGGQLSARMRRYAALINAQGTHALVIDSLSPRGERELCTQRTGQRRVTQTQRRRDALGALSWLADRPDVDRRAWVCSAGPMTAVPYSRPPTWRTRKWRQPRCTPAVRWRSTLAAKTNAGAATDRRRRC